MTTSSESATTAKSVVIPGELKLSNPVPPPVTVPLPIVAWPHEVKSFWLGILFLLNGVMFLTMAVVIPEFFVHAVSGTDNFFMSPRGGFILLILLFTFHSRCSSALVQWAQHLRAFGMPRAAMPFSRLLLMGCAIVVPACRCRGRRLNPPSPSALPST
jgi:hypothetical protein